MKGQMEFVIFLGIILVVVVVALYAYLGGEVVPSPVPQGVYEEQREVANSVKNVVRDAASKTLRTMMAHGGYLEDGSVAGISYRDVPHTDFMLRGVPYWHQCESVMYPKIGDVETWMEASIERMVREGMDDVELLYGNRAEFDRGKIEADVKILGVNRYEPDRIEITLNMPTNVRDYPMSGKLYPYEVKLDTQFGRIYAFGRDFAEASAQERFFDVFTIVAIYFSQILEDTHSKLPTFGVLTYCGEVLYRSPQQINTYLLEVVEYVMASTSWWQRMQNTTETKTFAIHDLNGNVYRDLDIRTMMADNWVFGLFDFILVTNFEMLRNDGYTIPVCTEVYNKAYNFNYPFIIRVQDRYTGYGFNFASMVSVKDRGDSVMEPGDCGTPYEPPPECNNLPCYARLRVVNDLGEPLPGAWVVFGDCPVGEADGNGWVEGPIQCGLKELFIYQDPEYEFLKRSVSATEINSTYVLNPIQKIELHFRDVSITRQGYYYDYEGERKDVECDACAKTCMIQKEISQQCSIGLIEREYAFVEFDNGYMRLPVTNVDMSSADPECRDSPDCVLCEQLVEELKENPEDLAKAQQAKEACSKCTQDCITTPVESATVDYLPSGYAYDVDAVMYDPLMDYMIKGGFSYSGFDLERDHRDVYVYVPRRSGDRSSNLDYEMTDSEKSCLVNALKRCEMEPVSTDEYVSNTVVLPDCSCLYMEGLAASCGSPRPDLFCKCPEGTVYPLGCSESCGGAFDESCTTCCDRTAVLEHLETLEESCGIRVVCP